MIRATYSYSFTHLSGKPKRFIESQFDCKLIGYGVVKDTVTFSVIYNTSETFKIINSMLETKFNIKPKSVVNI